MLLVLSYKLSFNPILPKLWKDVVTQGGAIMAPPCFFGFGATKSPKLNLGTFLALKTTWKAILNIFRSLSLVARGQQISKDTIVRNTKYSRFWVSRVLGTSNKSWQCTIQIELEKVRFASKKIKEFKISDFRLMLEDRQKFSKSNFSIF